MIEQRFGNSNPDEVLANLFQFAGGPTVGVEFIRESFARHQADPLDQAVKSANQGILQSAVEYVMASDLPTIEKIRKTSEMATIVIEFIAGDPNKTLLGDSTAGKRAIEFKEQAQSFLASV